MDKRVMGKFILLLFVGFGIIMYTIFNVFGNKPDEEMTPEEMFEQNNRTDNENEVDDEWLEEIEDEFGKEDEEKIGEEGTTSPRDKTKNEHNHEAYEVNEEFDHEGKYIKEFGKKVVLDVIDITEKVIPMWLKNNKEDSAWKEYSTSSFLKKINSKEKEETIKEIESLEVFPAEQLNEDEIIIGCIANYDDKTEYLNVIFVKEGDVFFINNIVQMWVN